MDNVDTLIKGLAIEGIIALYKKQNEEVNVESEDILEQHKRIMEAEKNWHKLSLEEKLEISEITNRLLPHEVRNWERDVEAMKDSSLHVSSSVKAYVGMVYKSNFMNWARRVLLGEDGNPPILEQTGNPLSLDNFKYDGKDVNLSDSFKKHIEDHRSRNS